MDLLIASALALVAFTEVWPGYLPSPERWGRVDWLLYGGPPLLALAGTLPLVVRRRYPVAVMLIIGYAAFAWDFLPGESTAAFLAMFVAVFSAGLYTSSRRRSVAGIAAFIAGAFGMWLVVASRPPGGLDVWLLLMFAFIGAIWLAGDVMRTRTLQARQLQEHAAELERRRELEVERAASEERMRIARELHDVVAHSMSVMVIQAAAALRVIDSQPEQAREAMRQVESTGRQAMAEMRRLLGVVRDGSRAQPTAPQPSLARLQELVDEFRAAGLPVTTRIEGEPRPLAPGLDVSAYRVLQEALTNAMRHAQASSVSVLLRYAADEIEISVTDDGGGPGAAAASERMGHGLVGMRERVALFGGELQAGAGSQGGFTVRARLPTGRSA